MIANKLPTRSWTKFPTLAIKVSPLASFSDSKNVRKLSATLSTISPSVPNKPVTKLVFSSWSPARPNISLNLPMIFPDMSSSLTRNLFMGLFSSDMSPSAVVNFSRAGYMPDFTLDNSTLKVLVNIVI